MKLLRTIETSPNTNGTTSIPPFRSSPSLTNPSYMRPISSLRALLPRLPPPPKTTTPVNIPPVARTPRSDAHRAHKRRRPPFRRRQARSHQRRRSAPLPAILHRPQQRRHPPRHRLRQRHRHPRLLRPGRAQDLPVPPRLHALAHLQHVLQHHLHPPLRLLRHRNGPHLQTWHLIK